MNTTAIQISTDLHELQEDIKAGLFDYLGAEIYWLREFKNITDKMVYGRRK